MTHLQELKSYAENEGADPKKLENYQDVIDWVEEHIKDEKIKNENPAQCDRMQKIIGDYNEITQGIKEGTPSNPKETKDKTVRETVEQKAKDQAEIDEETGGKINKKQAEDDADKLVKRG